MIFRLPPGDIAVYSFINPHFRLPAQKSLGFGKIGNHARSFAWPRGRVTNLAVKLFRDIFGDILNPRSQTRAEIYHLPGKLGMVQHSRISIKYVRNIKVIPALLSVAEHFQRLAPHSLADKNRNYRPKISFFLPLTKNIKKTYNGYRCFIGLKICKTKPVGRRL